MKYILVIILIMLVNSMAAVTIVVRQDGQGQFASIQPAVTASAHGDTVLVYPGTYYENINYSGKNITIASLVLTTGNQAYRDSTIIDGNNTGSCLKVISNENNAGIYGFTLQHGSGTPYLIYGATLTMGGGVRILNATNFKIEKCNIVNNVASSGGGVSIEWGTVFLTGTIITRNYVSMGGGGILAEATSNLVFSSVDRCSIYENYAGTGNDIYCVNTGSIIDVYLDIATVNPYTEYYIKYNKDLPNWIGGFGLVDILQGYRTEINHDMYLSPNGNDDNDGFSWATPKKTIAKAFHIIASDSLNPKSIHLSPGDYSSEESQIFPLNLKANVNLIGDLNTPPILINQRYEQTVCAAFKQNITVSNLTLEHGNYRPISIFTVSKSDNSVISNLDIKPVSAITYAGINIYGNNYIFDNIKLNGLSSISNSGIVYSGSNSIFKNISINDCHNFGSYNISEKSIFDCSYDSLLVIENLSITNCSVNFTDASIMAIDCTYANNPMLIMTDVLVANNTSVGQSPILFEVFSPNQALISNCSFVNNTGTNIAVKIAGNLKMSNCIYDNYNPTEVSIQDTQPYSLTSIVDFNNNLIHGYPNSIYIHPSNQVTFNPFNFSADPSFAGSDWTDPLSYRLNYNSPCIDAGTPDTTGLYLPEFDLYGNLRIYNGIIDIGCNEWNGTGNEDDYAPEATIRDVIVYPNPFNQIANIAFYLPKDSAAKISIYNTKGQLVREIGNDNFKQGYNKVIWDGRDTCGTAVSNGVYLFKMNSDGKNIVKKCILLK